MYPFLLVEKNVPTEKGTELVPNEVQLERQSILYLHDATTSPFRDKKHLRLSIFYM